MKKTLSHICVLLPLALVLAACEPETRVVEKGQWRSAASSRCRSRGQPRRRENRDSRRRETATIQPATDDTSIPTASGGGLPISSKRRPAGISLRFEWPRLSPTSHRRRSGIELVVSR